MSITVPLTAQPNFAIAAPALLQGAEITWDATATEPSFGDAKGQDAVSAKLAEKAPKDGPALPALPAKLDAKTPFVEVAAILDALDDFLAYRTYLSGSAFGYNDALIWGGIRCELFPSMYPDIQPTLLLPVRSGSLDGPTFCVGMSRWKPRSSPVSCSSLSQRPGLASTRERRRSVLRPLRLSFPTPSRARSLSVSVSDHL